MPVYKDNNSTNQMQKWHPPSLPEATIHYPTKLGYGSVIRIRSESAKVHLVPGDNGQQKSYVTIDQAAMEYKLVLETLLDPRTFHDLTKIDPFGNEVPIRMDEDWIAHTMNQEDAAALGYKLMDEFGGDLGVEQEEESAEGKAEEPKENVVTMPEKHDSRRGPKAKALEMTTE